MNVGKSVLKNKIGSMDKELKEFLYISSLESLKNLSKYSEGVLRFLLPHQRKVDMHRQSEVILQFKGF